MNSKDLGGCSHSIFHTTQDCKYLKVLLDCCPAADEGACRQDVWNPKFRLDCFAMARHQATSLQSVVGPEDGTMVHWMQHASL